MSDKSTLDNSQRPLGGHDPMRRMILGALGGTAGLIGCSRAGDGSDIAADEGDSETIFNAYNRTKTFDNNEMDSTPWVSPQTGNFDLDDPVQNRLARIKMTNNLMGQRTYIPMLIRLMIGREQNPGGPLLGAAGMFTWQLQVPDPDAFPDVPAGTTLLRSMFTARYLDPETMEPVERLKNPFNGKMMEFEDNLFIETFLNYPKGGSKLVEEPQFVNDDPETPKTVHFKRWGDELVIFLGGVYDEPGVHQPRFTENMWGSNYKDVMDPEVSLIDTRYTFTGINKAYEKPWAGYSVNDTDVLVDLAYGKKVHRPEDLPDFHKRVVVEKYPDRL